jgi:hypothetical protein
MNVSKYSALIEGVRVMVFNTTFNNISVISCVAVSFIVGGNQTKPPTCRKSLTNFIKYQVCLAMLEIFVL